MVPQMVPERAVAEGKIPSYQHITACIRQLEASEIPCHAILRYLLAALEDTWEVWFSETQESQVNLILHSFAL